MKERGKVEQIGKLKKEPTRGTFHPTFMSHLLDYPQALFNRFLMSQ
jgi:hypothetical protein